MATQQVVTLVDDLDGSEGAQPVRFTLGDEAYEIDLSRDNAQRLREVLAPYMSAGRRLTRTGKPYVHINLDELPRRRGGARTRS